MQNIITQRVVSATVSVIIVSVILSFSFLPTTNRVQSMTGPIFVTYIALLIPAVIYWKRLKGWADGYIGGFAIGAVIWVGYFAFRATTG